MSRLSRQLLKVTTSPWIGTLDRLATIAAGAWSLRRLRGGYAGPCLNVRRDADNATQDIGFTQSGDLSVAALLAFVGGGNGYLTAWYDQMPGASHLRQANANQQPQIVAAGSLVAYPSWAGRAAVMTNGGTSGANGSFLQTIVPAPALSFPQPFSRSSVLAFPWGLTPSNGNPIVLNSGNSAYSELYQTSASTLSCYAYDSSGNSGGTGYTSVTGIGAGTTGALLETFNQASSSAVFNGNVASGTVGSGAAEIMSVGANVNGSARCTHGLYGEVIEFANPLPAGDQQALVVDQCQYWQTPNPYRGVVLADAPYAYWPLTETGGTVAVDVSGNGRNGTYVGPVSLAAAQLLPSTSQRYLTLSGGGSDYVDVSVAAGFYSSTTWSIECWVCIASYAQPNLSNPNGTFPGVTFLVGDPQGGEGICWTGKTTALLYRSGSYASSNFVNAAPVLNALTHIVLVFNGSGSHGALYINGQLVTSSIGLNISPSAVFSPLAIGMQNYWCGAMNGPIGEVAVYAYALTAQQIATHYAAATASRTGLLDGLTTPVVGAWSMRRLRGGYTGPCLNVRRDSDNTSKDIGFTATGELDISSLLAFVGTAGGFVTTLYDQAANPSAASNLVQSVATRQPQIVAAGVLKTVAGRPARPAMVASATASSIQELLGNASKLTLSQPFSRASVTGIPAGATSSSFAVLTGSTNTSVIALNAANLKYQMYDYNVGFVSSNAVAAGANNCVMENFSTSASSIVVNGVSTYGSVGSGGDGTNLLALGALTQIAGASATFCEVILFGALLGAADQSAVSASQASYWGVTLTNG
jgi:Concanavalin A-like lectin/glucanases superfamily/Alpha-L-arabinofuranosidase B, catalytic